MSLILGANLSKTCKILRYHSFRWLQHPIASKQSTRHPLYVVNNRNFCCAYDVNTDIAKDVVLFKYENPKYFRMLNIFAICQLFFWSYLAHFSYTTLRDVPIDTAIADQLAWYQRINLGENKYRNTIAILCFLIGYGILCVSWMYTLRSVRFLILGKGGGSVSFVTYTPFGANRIMTVPLKDISAQESRNAAISQLPLKVQNRMFYYILDMRGEFKNTKLYDNTAGLKRKLRY